MQLPPVVLHPDARLSAVCEPVPTGAASDDMRRIASELLHAMTIFPHCVGIAAPQLGYMIRMIAIDVTGHKKAQSCAGPHVLINPYVIASSGRITMREGCLSIPDFTGDVERAESVHIGATSIDGNPVELKCDAFEARVVLHELDHLDGTLFIDRVVSARHIYPRRKRSQ